jgi:threonine/homoserine/homoserine lactone efflux protein
MHAALVGFGLGFLVAVQIGPMSLFLIRSTLRRGLTIGLSIGAGIALTDALYASLGVAGAAPLVSVEPVRIVLGIVGGAVLLVAGVAAGSASWFVALSLGVASVRRAVGQRALRVADCVAGLGLIGFGGLLVYESVDG